MDLCTAKHTQPRRCRPVRREHRDDDISLVRLLPMITLDSLVEDTTDDKISILPPPRRNQRGRMTLPSLSSLPTVPLPHTLPDNT